MSTGPREVDGEQTWATLEVPLSAVLTKRYQELSPDQITPEGHLRLADAFSADYRLGANDETRRLALEHYQAVLAARQKDRLGQAIVLVHRANIFLYDFKNGRMAIDELLAELRYAEKMAASVRTISNRHIKGGLLHWLRDTRARACTENAAEQDGSATEDYRPPHLYLVGSAAIKGADGTELEPSPEAA